MPDHSILLGFTLGTGHAVSIPLRHMAVVGQTQESGKTTTLEALVCRAQKPAIAFVTKRGERSFATGHRVSPYFRDRADWQFVCSIIDATLQEKNKFLRPWIMRICRTTHSLADVQREVRSALVKAKGINESVYTQLDAYLDLIIPDISRIPMTQGIKLVPGLNVMDVSGFAAPMQMLFVQSALDWINQHERDTIVIVPEAWEFVPEGRSSPVKASAISLVRKGAGIGNFIWVDSQDMAGVDKTILRGCTVWLIGVQREANEIKRNLSNIPAGIQRPNAADIARLDKGQFYACWKDRTAKVYVVPAWMPERDAWNIATGRSKIGDFSQPQSPPAVIDNVTPNVFSSAANHRVEVQVPVLSNGTATSAPLSDEEALYERFKARLMSESPKLLRVLMERPEIEVMIERPAIRMDGTSLKGRLAKMIADGFFDKHQSTKSIIAELQRLRVSATKSRVGKASDELVALGFLTSDDGFYQVVTGMKIKVVNK